VRLSHKEFEEIVIAVVEGCRAVDDKQSAKVYERDLEKIRKMMKEVGQNKLNK
jgi:hypothetical protein